MVHLSSTAIRRAAFVVAILGVAAAATAMWNRYAPPNACLFCAAPEHYETALNPKPTAAGTSGVAGDAYRTGQYASASSAVIPGASVGAAQSGGGSATAHGDVRRTWTPWSAGTDAHRFSASGATTPSVGMGGLWRLMNVVHRGEPAAAPVAHAAPAPREARPAAAPPVPKPPRSSAPAPNPPSAAPSPSPLPGPVPAPLPPLPPAPGPTATPSGGPVAPANPFTAHETPPSDPFVPPPPHGPLDPGGSGGTGTSGSGPAATPEPASLLLIATGLAALFAELRRRRAV